MADDVRVEISMGLAKAVEAIDDFVSQSNRALAGVSAKTAETSIQRLGNEYKRCASVIKENTLQIADLEAKAKSASDKEKAQIEQQIAGLKRLTSAREIELSKIKEKEVIARGAAAKAMADTDKEREAIEARTRQEVVAIQTKRDMMRAQQGVKSATEESTSAAAKFLSGWGSLAVITAGIGLAAKAVDEWKKKIEAADAAYQKLRDESKGVQGHLGSFFSEMGLEGDSKQGMAKKILADIGRSNNLSTEDTVAPTAAALAPALRGAGIGVTDPRFKDIVGNVGRFSAKGMNPQSLKAFVSSLLQENPQMSGDAINQAISQVVDVGGSPSEGSELLDIFANKKGTMARAGIDRTGFLQIASSMATGGGMEAPEIKRSLPAFIDQLQSFDGKDAMQARETWASYASKSPELASLIKPEDLQSSASVVSLLQRLKGKDRQRVANALFSGGGEKAAMFGADFRGTSLPGARTTGAPSDSFAASEAAVSAQRVEATISNAPEANRDLYEDALQRQMALDDRDENGVVAGISRMDMFGGKKLWAQRKVMGNMIRQALRADPKTLSPEARKKQYLDIYRLRNYIAPDMTDEQFRNEFGADMPSGAGIDIPNSVQADVGAARDMYQNSGSGALFGAPQLQLRDPKEMSGMMQDINSFSPPAPPSTQPGVSARALPGPGASAAPIQLNNQRITIYGGSYDQQMSGSYYHAFNS